MSLAKPVSLFLSLLFVLSFVSYAKSQPGQRTLPLSITDTVPVIDSSDYKIFEKVEIEAAFKGGDEAWRNFLERNLNAIVPVDNKAPAGYYTVVVQFVVDKEGKISDVKALTNHGYGMEAEVIRVIKKGPKWSPALQDGRFVRAYRKQPVTFMVIEEKGRKKKN